MKAEGKGAVQEMEQVQREVEVGEVEAGEVEVGEEGLGAEAG